jgi:tetratricopeptide (TPR) repeat protein
VALFHDRRFEQAKALFEKAATGPALEVAHAARVHIRMCEQRLNPPAPKPSSAEEHYAYGVALINQRELETAEKHLAEAARLAPDADHVYYALALCRGLRGDYEGAGVQLRRAIELQPQNRYLARRDPDFSGFVHQPPLERILWPERFERG